MDLNRYVSDLIYDDTGDESDVDGFSFEDEELAEAPGSPLDVDIPCPKPLTRAGNVDIKYDSDDSIKPVGKKKKKAATANVPSQSMKHNFASLPLNIMDQVFGHLHPLDLLSLAWTSKILRVHLMSKRLTNVWKKAREEVRPMIPECPKGQSEPQWAALLFIRDCFMCGEPEDSKVNWYLRLRGCKTCLEANLISAEAACQTYPNIDNLDDLLQLIPHTSRGHRDIPSKLYSRTRRLAIRAPPKLYYSAHIKRMVEIWMGYQLRIAYGIQGAHNEFVKFQERRHIEVKEQMESAEELKARTEEMEDQLIEERREAIVAKLVELNHDPRDVQNAVSKGRFRHSAVFEIPTPLSNADWERAKLAVETMVEKERLSRTGLERMHERMPILEERKRVAKSRYAIFRENYDASPDNLLPDDSVFLDIPIIKKAIESDGDDVLPRIFDISFNKLSDYLDQWRRERILDLARMLNTAEEAPSHVLNQVERDPAIAEPEEILLLATSVFTCCSTQEGQRNYSLHWFETVGHHLNQYHRITYQGSPTHRSLKCVQVIPKWIALVKELVRAVGLSPNTATQSDMDEHDARFYCKNCSVKKWGGKLARSWRNCVLHLGAHGTETAQFKGYELLSIKDRAAIKARETAISAWQAIDWNQVAISSQGVAVDFRGSLIELKVPPPRPRVMSSNHATATASNSTAIASKDPRAESQDTVSVKNLRCKLCPKSNREFALLGLMTHAMAKHGIKDPRRKDLVLV